ncbi:hypothetical protein QYF61_022229 [Mycteria americana]|uniref:Uncharacterized protein n=1 Tax=Mycteria americana TaxID=33587 RepID=A0AAN7NYD3_MYCAM|nr:hypothetical protein QYF61_022229 [Mycteria americana]
MFGLLGCKCTLPVELLINQHPQVLLLRAALNPFSAQPVFVLGIAPPHVQDLALGLVELHEVHTGPPLKPVKVPLNGIPSRQCVNCTTELGVIRMLAEGALNPTVHVANKDVKQHRHQAVDCNCLSVTIQPIPYPLVHPSNPCLSNLETRMSCGMVSNALHKSSQWELHWTATTCQGFIPWYSTKQIPEEAKVCSPEAQGSELAVHPPQCPKDLELHSFMVTAAKAALPCLLAELHALQLVIDIEGDTPSLSPLPVLPRDPVSFHSNTPVIGAIPPHLRDANKIIALQLDSTWHILVPGVVPPQEEQDFALLLVELHEIPVSPFLQPVKVPLDGSTTFWPISHSSQFCVISKLVKDELCLIIQIINEDAHQDWIQY